MEEREIQKIIAQISAALGAEDTSVPAGTLAVTVSFTPAFENSLAVLGSFLPEKERVRIVATEAGCASRGAVMAKQELLKAAAAAETVAFLGVEPDSLLRLAAGACACDAEQIALRALMWGKRVLLLTDYAIPRREGRGLRGNIGAAAEALRDEGFEIKNGAGEPAGKKKANEKGRQLVGEIDIIRAADRGEIDIICAADAVVTPAAQDKARELRIAIIRESRE